MKKTICATLSVGIAAAGLLMLVGCDDTTAKSKTETTKTTNTPEGVKKTTETTEKKVETKPN